MCLPNSPDAKPGGIWRIFKHDSTSALSTAPHLVRNVVILLLGVLSLTLKPLCPLGVVSRCLWGVLYQPSGQVSEVDHLRLQGPETLLLTSQALQALSTACLDGKVVKMNG